MKIQLKYIAMVVCMGMLMAACAEDWRDINPAPLLDGPALISLNANADTVQGGTVVSFTGAVSDAPGTIDSVAVSAKNNLGFEVGTISNLSFPKGSNSGQLTFDYKVPAEERGLVTVSVTVFDRQMRDGELVRKSATQSLQVFGYCPANLAGTYRTLASGDYGEDGAEPYEDLETSLIVTDLGAGVYQLNDMSFGVYPQIYGEAPPEGQIIITNCEENIITGLDNTDQFGDSFTINGHLNEDGTISLEWNNTYGDNGAVTLNPQ